MASQHRTKLTPKQLKFISHYVKDGNATNAVLHSYNVSSDNVAKAMGSELLSHPGVCSKIEHLCKKRGITEAWALKIIKRNGRAKKYVQTGKDIYTKVDDGSLQMDAAKTALKLHGHLKNNVEMNTDNRQVNIAVKSPEDIKALADIVSDLRALTAQPGDPAIDQSGEVVDVESYRVD